MRRGGGGWLLAAGGSKSVSLGEVCWLTEEETYFGGMVTAPYVPVGEEGEDNVCSAPFGGCA